MRNKAKGGSRLFREQWSEPFDGLLDRYRITGQMQAPLLQCAFQLHGRGRLKSTDISKGRFAEHGPRRSLKMNPSLLHNRYLRRHTTDQIHIVADDNECSSLVAQAFKKSNESCGALEVEAGGRLIEHQYLGVHGQDAREGDAAFLTSTQRKWLPFPETRQWQTYQFERFCD